ncbi:glucose dehydrogenase [FAD, quinone] [Hyalella azteca]|uniref:Glucose dehydrogenase [FAD, quinone] n=1 Tax=Hyalella azteca TaxID=294128 RepID=A0A8B7PM88_HYAAZ|nr:glucose dehydrogenase [FAD, quinone] [Hyalella azteca]
MGQSLANTVLALALGFIANLLVGKSPFPTVIVDDEVTVDFIVVGSGSAGSPVAARLSEVEEWQVLVLEAGGQPSPESAVPGISSFAALEGSAMNYNYRTTPQKYAQFSYTNNTTPYPSGKVIGGSSVINYMMYNRGNKFDFDRWAALGNPGWDYQTVLKYFKKLEDYGGQLTAENRPYHGTGGPLRVENKRWGSAVMTAFLAAGLELGHPTLDINAGSQMGFNTPDVTVKNGKRHTAADAFLRPNLQRPNLRLQSGSHVTKILFDDNLKATGVEYRQDNKTKRAYARKEVVVCAGAIDSPKLLLLSGIGPQQHLQGLGIKTLVDLPGVGENLQDHPTVFGISWSVPKGEASSVKRVLGPSSKLLYKHLRKGPLSAPLGVEGNAWMRLEEGGDPTVPDMQFLIISQALGFNFDLLLSSAISLKNKEYRGYLKALRGIEGFNIGPMLTVPKSRGSVTLRSSDPFDPPLIDPNFLSHPDDVELFLKGIKFALAIGNTTAMRDGIGAMFVAEPLPGCQTHPWGSDDYWRCFTRHMASTTYHPAGTCKMAPLTDPLGVVTSTLKVRGVNGLRVIDASIMPYITSANTNAPAIMIGERGADFIKEDHGIQINI